MCGIAGIIRLDGGPVEEERLRAMNRAMVHRGPDGEGFWNETGTGLAHLRLAIIDLATGDQPMFNEDATVLVIFNGEIYNFLDLKPELQSCGHVFRTNSDTEVLVHAYEEWGCAMVSKLNGMFAFALYDTRKRKLFIARDRLGVKPLYYYLGRDVFVFASEMGGMIASGLLPRDIDPVALELYLHYQYIPSPHTIYRDVKKLAPAEYTELDLATRQIKRASYWDISTQTAPIQSKSLNEWLEELDALINDAVRIRLISDVPFGAFLSGGTDSGLVVALMAGKLNEPVKTFSIGLAEDDKDELPYARMVAQKYHTQHEEFRVAPEGLTLIPKLCRHFGEPFADSSAIPTYYVSQMARTRVKMALTGDGGDEMFGGYRSYAYLVHMLAQNGNALAALRVRRWLAVLRNRLLGRAQTARANPELSEWFAIYDASMSHFSFAERRALLGEYATVSPADYFTSQFAFSASDSVVGKAQYCDVKSYLPGDILVKVDRMSMANSLEVRSPLLDYRVAELAFRMPTRIKVPEPLLDGSKNKFVLKELASRYLGREYVYRPKEGFGIPVSRWLREDVTGYLKDALLGTSPVYDYLDKAVAQKMIQLHCNGSIDYGAKIWNLLMLDGWLRYVHSVQ